MISLNQIEANKDLDSEVAESENQKLSFESGRVGSRLIASAKFNAKRGVLTIIRNDGSTLDVGGLPTPDMFGAGKQGARGKRGRDGIDGRNGRDGKDGKDGCAGETGKQGRDGIKGEPGPDGLDGYRGDTGFAGARGETGDQGAQGEKGVKGPKGNPGPSCIIGARGETGNKPVEAFVFSQTKPTDRDIRLWAFETDSDNPENLPDIQPINASMSDLVLTALRAEANGTWYHAFAYPEVILSGDTHNPVITWEIIDNHLYPEMSIEPYNLTARFSFRDQVFPSQTYDKTVMLRATIKDLDTTLVVTSKVRVIARNGTNHMCLVFGTLVETPSGFKAVEQLRIGDKIAAFTGQPKIIDDWRSPEILGSKMWATVLRANTGFADQYIEINQTCRLTPEHPLLANTGGAWRYARASQLTNSDNVWTDTGAQRATVRTVNRSVSTVDIQIDVLNAFFAGNVLIHNMDTSGYDTKRSIQRAINKN